MLDLSKAFDTVNHSTLFDKLEHCGIRGLALKWIRSYFSNRLHFVEYNGYVSSRANIMSVVPQGSILEPLFFSALHQRCRVEITRIKNCLTNTLNAELDKLLSWFRPNRLSLNLRKKKFIVFKPCQKRTNQTIQLLINGQKIDY